MREVLQSGPVGEENGRQRVVYSILRLTSSPRGLDDFNRLDATDEIEGVEKSGRGMPRSSVVPPPRPPGYTPPIAGGLLTAMGLLHDGRISERAA